MSEGDAVVGLVHPGAMGAAVGKQLVDAGTRTLWVSEGRGSASRGRAVNSGLDESTTHAGLAACSVIISVCPPAAAHDVAEMVAATGFRGIYVDANAISPARAVQIEELFGHHGCVVVDGGIIGPPPVKPDTTRLYLSGPPGAVGQVADLFASTMLRPFVVDGAVGKASALKLAFATYNKLTFVLAAQAYGLATHHGVDGDLRDLAEHVLPDTPLGKPDTIATAGQRAWRWEGEMAEIASACLDGSIRAELLAAAEVILAQWRPYKDDRDITLTQLVEALRSSDG